MSCVSVKASNGNQWWSTDTFVMNVQCLPKSSNGVIVLQICTLSCDAKSDWMSHVWSITTIEGFSLFVLRPQRTKPFYHLWMTLSESKRCCQKLGNATTADCGFNLTKPTQYLTLYSFRRFLCFFQRQSVMKNRHVCNACRTTVKVFSWCNWSSFLSDCQIIGNVSVIDCSDYVILFIFKRQ